MKNKRVMGIIMAILTGVGWGLSGVFSQFLFSTTAMKPGWFVSIRMLVSGIVLVFINLCTDRVEFVRLLKSAKDLIVCIVAGTIGTMMFQMSCYSAVKESNAPTAIVLQYLCPVMIIVYICIVNKRIPRVLESISLILAIAGIFVISTHGDIHQLVLTPKALFYGIGSAFFMSLGSIIPEKMYSKYSVQSVTSIMLLSGGVVASVIIRPWLDIPQMQTVQVVSLVLAILFGSVFAYMVYAFAIKYIGSAKASLCACAEIPTATILAVLCLGNDFTVMDMVGFILIAATIFLSSVKKKEGR